MSYLNPSQGWLRVALEDSYGQGQGTGDWQVLQPTEAPEVSEENVKVEHNPVSPTVDSLPHGTIKDHATLSATVYVCSNNFDDSDQTPTLSPVIEAGMGQVTTSGDTSSPPVQAEYSFAQDMGASAVFEWTFKDKTTGDWLRWTLKGARCTWTMSGSEDERLTMDIEATAKWAKPEKVSSPTLPSGGIDEPFIAQNISYSLGDTGTSITSFEFSPNHETNAYTDTEGEEKLKETLVSAGDPPGGSVDPKATLDSVTGSSGEQAAGREAKTDSWTITVDNGNGKSLELDCPRTTIDPTNPDTSNPARYDLTYEAHETAYGAGDSWKLKWIANS
jgi:hypothetical protein